MNSKFQNAMRGIPQKTPPIWLMRQAGRYHNHYQSLRKKNSFLDLCRKPELAAEVALGPIRDFDFDVAILFSDILFPLDAIGMGLDFNEKGPNFQKKFPELNLNAIPSLSECLQELQFQAEAMRLTRSLLPKDKSLVGFVGGLFTLFTFAMEDSHKSPMTRSKVGITEFYGKFTEILKPLLIENIRLQFDAGAEVVYVMDSSVGELSPQDFSELVLPDLKEITASFTGKICYYAKGITQDYLVDPWWKSGPVLGMGYDHRWNIPQLLKEKNRKLVQGGFDHTMMLLGEDDFKRKLMKEIESWRELSLEDRRSWICGLSHGVLPTTPEKNVKMFVQQVRERL